MKLAAHLRRIWRRNFGPTRQDVVDRIIINALRRASENVTYELNVSPSMRDQLDALKCHLNVATAGEVLATGVYLLAAISRDGGPIVCDVPARRGRGPRRVEVQPAPRLRLPPSAGRRR